MLRLFLSSQCRAVHRNVFPSSLRCICSTPHLSGSWMDKMKGLFTGQKTESADSVGSFTLLQFAKDMRKAKAFAKLKGFVGRRGSEAALAPHTLEKYEAIVRYLGGIDPTGENIQRSQKLEAAKQCNCTMEDVENTLAKFTWTKEARRKIAQLQAEGKPLPKSFDEVQNLVGSPPPDVAGSNLPKSGQISRNRPCPCGSKKLYKRCCGKDKSS